jgi:hypothetical protein
MARIHHLVAMLLLAGCTGSKLSAELRAADAACDQDWRDKTSLVDCLAAHERPVWATGEPETLALYDAFAAQRADLAHRLDQGSLTDAEYQAELARTKAEFKERMAAERRQQPPARAASPESSRE